MFYNQVMQPELDQLRRSLEGLNQSSGLVRISASMQGGESMHEPNLVEIDDMRRVDFVCHDEPVKVLDDWNGPAHCLICGQLAT